MKSGSRLSNCGTTPTRARASRARRGTGSPSSSISPASGSIRPRQSLSVVVLPAPFGPEQAEALAGRDREVDAADDFRARRTTCAARAHRQRRSFASSTGRCVRRTCSLRWKKWSAPGTTHHRQLLRPRPVEHRGERHGVVVLAVDHQRVRRAPAAPSRRVTADADQHQPLRLRALARAAPAATAPKEKPGEHELRRRSHVLEHGGEIVELAAALVVHALGLRRRRGSSAARSRSRARRRRARASAPPCCRACRRTADADARSARRRAASPSGSSTAHSMRPAGPATNSRRVLARITSSGARRCGRSAGALR